VFENSSNFHMIMLRQFERVQSQSSLLWVSLNPIFHFSGSIWSPRCPRNHGDNYTGLSTIFFAYFCSNVGP